MHDYNELFPLSFFNDWISVFMSIAFAFLIFAPFWLIIHSEHFFPSINGPPTLLNRKKFSISTHNWQNVNASQQKKNNINGNLNANSHLNGTNGNKHRQSQNESFVSANSSNTNDNIADNKNNRNMTAPTTKHATAQYETKLAEEAVNTK